MPAGCYDTAPLSRDERGLLNDRWRQRPESPWAARDIDQMAREHGVSRRTAERWVTREAEQKRGYIPKSAERTPYDKLPPGIQDRIDNARVNARGHQTGEAPEGKAETAKDRFSNKWDAIKAQKELGRTGDTFRDKLVRSSKMEYDPATDTWVVTYTYSRIYRSGGGEPCDIEDDFDPSEFDVPDDAEDTLSFEF